MALFEGSVAFVMIGAVMKSMDPALEEASQVIGAGRLRTMLRITLPLVLPGVLGAAIFVFAEMLGSFSAALVLGLPDRFYVVTTAMYQLVSQYPPRIPARRRDGRVAVRRDVRDAVHLSPASSRAAATSPITGKAFRPRVMDVGRPALAALRRLRALSAAARWSLPVADAGLCLGPEDSPSPFRPRATSRSPTISTALTHERRALGARQQPAARRRHRDASASC